MENNTESVLSKGGKDNMLDPDDEEDELDDEREDSVDDIVQDSDFPEYELSPGDSNGHYPYF